MRYGLSRFKSGSDHIDQTWEPGAFGSAEAEDYRLAGPVHLTADLTKSGTKVALKGRLTATLELACSRCLEPYVVPVDAALDLTFLPAPNDTVSAPAAPAKPRREDGRRRKAEAEDEAEDDDASSGEMSADDVGLSYYSGDEIDLGQMMREQFYLALPMKPLCQADCQGLCPHCGVNRNRETCSCVSTWVDPRFEVLKQLKKD
jgi:uncharacterized protein